MIKLVLKLSPNERECLQVQHVSIKDVKIDEKLKSLKIEFSSKINLIFYHFPASWVKFFTNAGIPSPTNATYAHIFVENRIQMDMLCELNKEHLKEVKNNEGKTLEQTTSHISLSF